MLIALVSKVILLVLLSNFAQCALPCAHLNPVARIPWAPSTAQNLKVTLRMTFEYAPNMMIVKVHPQYLPLLSSGLIKLHFCHMTQLAQLQLSYPHKIFSALGVRDLVSCS